MAKKGCEACGFEFERNARGRPRKFCWMCAPAGDMARIMRAWRKANPEKVAAYNASRRIYP
jgi:hypothetical protein